MKHTLLATALAATAIVAAPIFSSQAQNAGAQPAQPPAATAPAGLAQPVAPSAGGQMAAEEEGEGERGGAPMMEHHEQHLRHMMGRMMMGEMGMRGDPQQHCIDRLAWRAARMAFVETKLDLTAAQRPLWDKIETAAENEQQKERQLCNDLGNENRSTVIERMNRWQQFLTARLDGLRQAKPAVQALYQALSPEQRAIFNHPFGRS